jgi:hypothetical protein
MSYPDKILLLAYAITRFEGMASGSTSHRNKNPGNLRWHGQAGTVKADASGYAVFATLQDGVHALLRQLMFAATGQSAVYQADMTLEEFFQVYAPHKDHNDPGRYARFAAAIIGTETTTTLKELL